MLKEYPAGPVPAFDRFNSQHVYIPRRRSASTRRPPRSRSAAGLPVTRLASHGLILSVALGVAFVTGNSFPFFPAQPASLGALPAWPQSAHSDVGVPVDRHLQYVQKSPVPLTQTTAAVSESVAEATPKPQSYLVQDGDTLFALAARFGVTAESIMWANSLASPDRLTLDAELRIPPVTGVLHTVGAGDSLSAIAQRYSAQVDEILTFKGNEITDPDALVLGMEIMVPGGMKRAEAPLRLASSQASQSLGPPAPRVDAPAIVAPPASTGALMWPTYGSISNWFAGYAHKGVDILGPYGNPVFASDGGVVSNAYYDRSGYGYLVTVDHGNGLQTWYAHMSEILVQGGQRVARGEQVGRVGMTGYATGPHLHFEVRSGGVPVNPVSYLGR